MMNVNALDLGPLEDLQHDSTITDIVVTGDGRVWVDRGKGMEAHQPSIPLRSPLIVKNYAMQLCAQLGRRLDDACPIADASTISGVRVHAVIEPLVPYGASISIRLPSYELQRLDVLGSSGFFPRQWHDLLVGLVRNRATILITGSTGVGKTTLLKAFLMQCPEDERIVTVEEVRELGDIGRANHVALMAREANVEGVGEISLADLVKATLRMRPDRIVLGECRGEEIADVLRAFNSGHRGSMVTLHAENTDKVPSRLISLGLLAGMDPRALAMLAGNAFDAVIHVERLGRKRHIAQIGLLDIHGETLVGVPVATWDGDSSVVPGPLWQHLQNRWI